MEAFKASVALLKSEAPFMEGSWNLRSSSRGYVWQHLGRAVPTAVRILVTRLAEVAMPRHDQGVLQCIGGCIQLAFSTGLGYAFAYCRTPSYQKNSRRFAAPSCHSRRKVCGDAATCKFSNILICRSDRCSASNSAESQNPPYIAEIGRLSSRLDHKLCCGGLLRPPLDPGAISALHTSRLNLSAG